MKKFTALILILLLILGVNPVFADSAEGYSENFDNGEIGEISIKNTGFYQTDFVGGIGAKSETDKSLALKRPETKEQSGSSIYTEMSLSLYKKYFKFMANLI